MARDIESESDYYRSQGGIIPVKWTAPEALNYNKYTSASDVWSFGMVLFEIWSVGEKPFNDLTNPIVSVFYNNAAVQLNTAISLVTSCSFLSPYIGDYSGEQQTLSSTSPWLPQTNLPPYG